jgi:DNA (cytosine-5)-methyltransferase 1
MYSAVSLCAGGGLAAGGMRDAGVALAGAVEYDPAIAGVYSANFDTPIIIAPIQDVDFTQYTGVDIGQFSPPCPNFSVAKRGTESDVDQAIADAGVRFLETVRPRYFWLENVEGYARSKSYRTIRAALDRLDYWSHCEVVNAADYGVPQTRRRLILRASAGGFMQPFRPLPAPVPWRGWYEAIADLIPDLPLTEFAPWQIPLLPDWVTAPLLVEGKGNRLYTENEQGDLTLRSTGDPAPTVRVDARFKAFIMDGQNAKTPDRGVTTIRYADQPMITVPATLKGVYRAFVMSGHSGGAIRPADEPMVTLTASDISNTIHKAWLETGRVVKMTPRALARFQSVPDSYQLPASNRLAARIIGNGVPWLLAQRITESLLY